MTTSNVIQVALFQGEQQIDSGYGRLTRSCSSDALTPGTYSFAFGNPFTLDGSRYDVFLSCVTCPGEPPVTRTPTSTPTVLPDGYEPDGDPSSATRIKCGESQVHTIAPRGDQDWFDLRLDEVSSLQFYTYATVEVYRADGSEVVQPFGSCFDQPLEPGDYKLRVKDQFTYAFEYFIAAACTPCAGLIPPTATPEPTVGADGLEPDDEPGQAKAIACGETLSQTVWPAGDPDYRKVSLPALSTLVIDVENAAGATILGLFTASGDQIEINYGGPRIARNCGIDALDAGDYLIRVSNYYSSEAFPYDLRVRCLPCDLPNPTVTPTVTPTITFTPTPTVPPDAYEPDDDPQTAHTIACGESQSRSLPSDDQDWLSFTLDEAQSVTIEMFGPYGYRFLELYDASLGWIAEDNTGVGFLSRLDLDLAAGTYFLRLQVISFDGPVDSSVELRCGPPPAPTVGEGGPRLRLSIEGAS